MNTTRIEPRTLSGFRDFPPAMMMPRERLIETAKRVYRSYGFAPIDTPALEYLEILNGKGSEETDRQMYKFEDHGKRKVGMRFDLTVPLARFMAQHVGDLGTPFKRYHIATVWRGEHAQRGRYREFMQCDFDTIGTKSIVADIETSLVIYDLLQAIGVDKFQVHVNNRMVLNGLLEKLGLRESSTSVLRAIDKLAKVGEEKVIEEIVEKANTSAEQAAQVVKLCGLTGSNDEILSSLSSLVAGSELGEQGVAALEQVIRGVRAAGVPERFVQIDVSIARGLDYYTGTIYETLLDEMPSIGSVCSGGRYDNLAELFTKQELPGIGASLGLDRLLAALEEMGRIPKVRTPADVMIAFFDASRLHDYLAIASKLRKNGIGVELYPESKKLGQQLKYADRQGFRLAIIAGENELKENVVQLKDLTSGNSTTLSLDGEGVALSEAVKKALANQAT